MSAPAIERMTIDEFLVWENEQERKYELVDGVPIMMTGGTMAHDMVRGAVSALFRAQLRQKPCRAHLDVKLVCPTGNARYPDAMIDCGPYRGKDLVASKPTIVVEVLSPSTRATDFLVKSLDYESVQSISTYAIFWQDEAKAVIYRRQGGRLTIAEQLSGLDGMVQFPDVEVSIAMADIYEGAFDDAE
jgi:Uma2 family endonuclease